MKEGALLKYAIIRNKYNFHNCHAAVILLLCWPSVFVAFKLHLWMSAAFKEKLQSMWLESNWDLLVGNTIHNWLPLTKLQEVIWGVHCSLLVLLHYPSISLSKSVVSANAADAVAAAVDDAVDAAAVVAVDAASAAVPTVIDFQTVSLSLCQIRAKLPTQLSSALPSEILLFLPNQYIILPLRLLVHHCSTNCWNVEALFAFPRQYANIWCQFLVPIVGSTNYRRGWTDEDCYFALSLNISHIIDCY